MKRIPFLVSLIALSLSILVLAPQAGAQDHDERMEHMKEAHSAEIEHPDVVLDVDGLHCQACAYSLVGELEGIEAIEEVSVLIDEDQQVQIALKEGQTITEEDIREAVRASGFEEHFELKGTRFPNAGS